MGAVPFLGPMVRAFDNLDEIGASMRAFAEKHDLSFIGAGDPNFQSPRSRDPYSISQVNEPRAISAKNSLISNFACIAPGSLDTSLSHAAGLSDIAVCHA